MRVYAVLILALAGASMQQEATDLPPCSVTTNSDFFACTDEGIVRCAPRDGEWQWEQIAPEDVDVVFAPHVHGDVWLLKASNPAEIRYSLDEVWIDAPPTSRRLMSQSKAVRQFVQVAAGVPSNVPAATRARIEAGTAHGQRSSMAMHGVATGGIAVDIDVPVDTTGGIIVPSRRGGVEFARGTVFVLEAPSAQGATAIDHLFHIHVTYAPCGIPHVSKARASYQLAVRGVESETSVGVAWLVAIAIAVILVCMCAGCAAIACVRRRQRDGSAKER